MPPMDPPLYHDIRFTVVGIDRGLVVHGVGQVSMQITTLFEEISPEALKKCLQKPFIYQQESNGNSVTICALAAIIKSKIVIFVLNYITV